MCRTVCVRVVECGGDVRLCFVRLMYVLECVKCVKCCVCVLISNFRDSYVLTCVSCCVCLTKSVCRACAQGAEVCTSGVL